MDLKKAFPQFFHILLTLNKSVEEYEYIDYLREQGIKYMCCAGPPILSEQVVKQIDPFAIFLHNTKGDQIRGSLSSYRVIAVHHNVTKPMIDADVDWFVSDYIRKAYRKCKMRNAFTLPPCIYTPPFTSVKRDPNRPVRVGRIQSKTKLAKGKVPPKFYDLLKKVKAEPYVMLTGKPGMMPTYLSECDIFAIWGETTESWSRVASEASLSGIPIVARGMGDGLSEQVLRAKSGLLADTEGEFVELLNLLIDDVRYANELADQGRQWCLENVGLHRIQEKLMPILLQWGADVL